MKGESEVDILMTSVDKVLMKYVKWPSDQFTEIYNRAYEVVLSLFYENEKLSTELAQLREQTKRHDPSEIPPVMEKQIVPGRVSIPISIDINTKIPMPGYYDFSKKQWRIFTDESSIEIKELYGWYFLPGWKEE